jgi:hypothetical protein
VIGAATNRSMMRAIRIAITGRIGWYPTLIGLVYIVEPIAKFDVDLSSGARLIALVLALGLVVTVGWTRLLGKDRGGLAAAITLMALVGATSQVKLLPFVAAIILLVVEWTWSRRGTLRIRVPWSRVTEGLNVLLVVLLLVQLVGAVNVRLQRPAVGAASAWTAAPVADAPNIYVILVDGHGRQDVLRDAYAYDGTAFEQAMTGMGFKQATGSFANHAATRFSLAVLLNGRPLSEMGQNVATVLSDALAYASLRSSSGIALLNEAGYETTAMVSGYEGLAPGNVDHLVDTGPRNELERTVIDGTAIGGVLTSLGEGNAVGQGYRTLRQVALLKEMAKARPEIPQFVFAHLPAPHPPFVLDAGCAIRPEDELTLGSTGRTGAAGDVRTMDLVGDQTTCIDRLITDVVDDIVTTQPNAVVIVLSDHGPEEELDWWHPSDAAIAHRMANLFWSRTPGHANVFPDDVTLVNVLPLLFNAYLGTELPTHPDDLYFGPTPNNSYMVPYTP